MKKDTCQEKGCKNEGKFARYCGHYKIEAEPAQTIQPYSKKRQEINRKQYTPEVKRFLAQPENKFCTLKFDNQCTVLATVVHHSRGRASIKDLLNVEYWMPSCEHCNIAIEDKDGEARDKGLKLSKFNPDYKRTA
jgi:hypothetical protein